MNPIRPASPMHRRESGLTLIELMIAVTLGLIIIGTIAYVFVSSRQAYRLQENMSRMQENGRYAMLLLGRELRNVGYAGCAGNTDNMTLPPCNPAAGTTCNTLNNPTAYAYNFGIGLQGYTGTSTGWSPSLPSALQGLGELADTDVVTIRSMADLGITVTKHPGFTPNPGSSDIQVTGKTSSIADGDLVMASDCSYAAVFQITNINTNGGGKNVVHNSGGSTSPGNSTSTLGENFYHNGGQLLKAQSKAYFIRTGQDGQPALWVVDLTQSTLSPQEVVGDVENMRLTYGVDTTGDGAVDEYDDANTVDTAGNWGKVLSVRVSLLLISPDNNVVASPQGYSYNGSSVTATDRRLRYVYTSTIGLRNRLP